MFDTPYNRMIANKVNAINSKYVASNPVHSGRGRSGALEEGNATLAFNPAHLREKQLKGAKKYVKKLHGGFDLGYAAKMGAHHLTDHLIDSAFGGKKRVGRGDADMGMLGEEAESALSGMIGGKSRNPRHIGGKKKKQVMDYSSGDDEFDGMMGSGRKKATKKPSASSGKLSKQERGQMVKEIMAKHGVNLGEASKMLKHQLSK